MQGQYLGEAYNVYMNCICGKFIQDNSVNFYSTRLSFIEDISKRILECFYDPQCM